MKKKVTLGKLRFSCVLFTIFGVLFLTVMNIFFGTLFYTSNDQIIEYIYENNIEETYVKTENRGLRYNLKALGFTYFSFDEGFTNGQIDSIKEYLGVESVAFIDNLYVDEDIFTGRRTYTIDPYINLNVSRDSEIRHYLNKVLEVDPDEIYMNLELDERLTIKENCYFPTTYQEIGINKNYADLLLEYGYKDDLGNGIIVNSVDEIIGKTIDGFKVTAIYNLNNGYIKNPNYDSFYTNFVFTKKGFLLNESNPDFNESDYKNNYLYKKYDYAYLKISDSFQKTINFLKFSSYYSNLFLEYPDNTRNDFLPIHFQLKIGPKNITHYLENDATFRTTMIYLIPISAILYYFSFMKYGKSYRRYYMGKDMVLSKVFKKNMLNLTIFSIIQLVAAFIISSITLGILNLNIVGAPFRFLAAGYFAVIGFALFMILRYPLNFVTTFRKIIFKRFYKKEKAIQTEQQI